MGLGVHVSRDIGVGIGVDIDIDIGIGVGIGIDIGIDVGICISKAGCQTNGEQHLEHVGLLVGVGSSDLIRSAALRSLVLLLSGGASALRASGFLPPAPGAAGAGL